MLKTYLKSLPAAWRQTSKVFTALGDEHRQRILLAFHPGEELTVRKLVEVSPLSRTAVTHHLRVLREAGILRSEKRGKEVFLWIDRNVLQGTFEAVLNYVKANVQ